MRTQQRNHIATVIEVAAEETPAISSYDEAIVASWRRCVHEHELDPTRMQEPIILPCSQLRERQEGMEEFLHIARPETESLYQQIAGAGYCILLTDARGATVDFVGDEHSDADLHKAGLYLGADWCEAAAGTNGIGTCIAMGCPVTVHQEDHFDATHIPLTCSGAPLFDVDGQLKGVLDLSALVSPEAKHSQHLALQLANVSAQRMENAYFRHHFRHDWTLRLLHGNAPEMLIALDGNGRVVGHNRSAQQHFGAIMGMPIGTLLNVSANDLGQFVSAGNAAPRPVASLATQRMLQMQAIPPAAPSQMRQDAASNRRKMEKLSALSSIVVGISHELNTPLGNSKLALSTLRDRILDIQRSCRDGTLTRSQMDSFLDEGIRIADLANRASDRAAALVDSFRQISTDPVSWRRDSFELAPLLREAMATEQRADPRWQFSVELPADVNMDSYPEAMQKVIASLVQNSVQHGFEGRDYGQITLSGHVEADSPHLVLYFGDDGCGIAGEILERIFDPFFTTRFGRGCSGLGLTTIHHIVTSVLGGEITAGASAQNGAAFTLRIPLQAPVLAA